MPGLAGVVALGPDGRGTAAPVPNRPGGGRFWNLTPEGGAGEQLPETEARAGAGSGRGRIGAMRRPGTEMWGLPGKPNGGIYPTSGRTVTR